MSVVHSHVARKNNLKFKSNSYSVMHAHAHFINMHAHTKCFICISYYGYKLYGLKTGMTERIYRCL